MKSVRLPHSGNFEPLGWAIENCPSYIKSISCRDPIDVAFSVYGRPVKITTYEYYIEYYFDDDIDAVLFKMRWL